MIVILCEQQFRCRWTPLAVTSCTTPTQPRPSQVVYTEVTTYIWRQWSITTCEWTISAIIPPLSRPITKWCQIWATTFKLTFSVDLSLVTLISTKPCFFSETKLLHVYHARVSCTWDVKLLSLCNSYFADVVVIAFSSSTIVRLSWLPLPWLLPLTLPWLLSLTYPSLGRLFNNNPTLGFINCVQLMWLLAFWSWNYEGNGKEELNFTVLKRLYTVDLYIRTAHLFDTSARSSRTCQIFITVEDQLYQMPVSRNALVTWYFIIPKTIMVSILGYNIYNYNYDIKMIKQDI